MTDYSRWDKFDADSAEKALRSQEYTNDLLRGNKEVEAAQRLLQKNVVSSAAVIKSKELVLTLKETVPLDKRKHHRFNLSCVADTSNIVVNSGSSVDFVSDCMNNISDMINNITRNVEKLQKCQDGVIKMGGIGYFSGYSFGIEITKELSKLINYAKVLTTVTQKDLNYATKLVEDIYKVANHLLRQTVTCTSMCALFIGKFSFVVECNSYYVVKNVSDDSTYVNILLLGCSFIGIGNIPLAIKYLEYFYNKCPQYTGIEESLKYLKDSNDYNENIQKMISDGSIYLSNILRHLDKSLWNKLDQMSIKTLSKEMIYTLLQSQITINNCSSLHDYIDEHRPSPESIVDAANSLQCEGKILFIEKMYHSASIKYISVLLLLDAVANNPAFSSDTRVSYLKFACLVNTALCKVQLKPVEELCLMLDEYEDQLSSLKVLQRSYLKFLVTSSPLILIKEAASNIESVALKIKEIQILEKMNDFGNEILELEKLINRIQSNNEIISRDPFICNRDSSFTNECMSMGVMIPLTFASHTIEIESEFNFSGELIQMLKYSQFLDKKFSRIRNK